MRGLIMRFLLVGVFAACVGVTCVATTPLSQAAAAISAILAFVASLLYTEDVLP